MNIVLLRWLWFEIKDIFFRIIREIRHILKWSFSDYLKKLLLGKNKNNFYVFLRIFLFLFIFRLILDILKIIFRFYYLIVDWFFYVIQTFVYFYIEDVDEHEFYFNLIDFFEYIFLLRPFIRLNERLVRTNRKLYVYIIERSIYYSVRVMWWRPRFRRKLAIPVEAFEFLVIFFGVVPSAFFVMLIFTPILDLFAGIYDNLVKWRVFFGIIYYVKQYNKITGVNHLRSGASLFHIAVLLQKQGFEVPRASLSDKVKARYEYMQYRRTYKLAEFTPEKLDSKALDVYVFLLDLFKDTRYALNPIQIKDFFLIMFPYEILYTLFCYSYYLYMGLIYLLCPLLFPIVIIHIILSVLYELFKRLEVLHFLFFRDLEDLAREKEKIWDQIREDSLNENKNKWYKDVRKIWSKYTDELKG